MKSRCVYVYTKVFAFHFTFLRLLYLETPLTRFFARKKTISARFEFAVPGDVFFKRPYPPPSPYCAFFFTIPDIKKILCSYTHSVIAPHTRRENKTEEAPENPGGQTVR